MVVNSNVVGGGGGGGGGDRFDHNDQYIYPDGGGTRDLEYSGMGIFRNGNIQEWEYPGMGISGNGNNYK